MTVVIWLVTILPLLDLVINRGQSALTFLFLILLVLPTPLVIIMPIAFFSPPCSPCIACRRQRAGSDGFRGYSLRQWRCRF